MFAKLLTDYLIFTKLLLLFFRTMCMTFVSPTFTGLQIYSERIYAIKKSSPKGAFDLWSITY